MTYQRFRSTVADNQIVEAVQYLADGSNAAYVRQFLEHHHPSEWLGPHTYMCGPDYRTIGVSIFGNPTFITPGNIAYVDIRTKQVRTMFSKDFLTYYTSVSTPEPATVTYYMSAPASYRRQHQNNQVTAIRYAKGRNSTAIMDMLIPYGSITRFAAHKDTERLSFRPNKSKCRVAGLVHEDADFFLPDGQWITITDRPGSVPFIKLYNDTDFQYLLRPYTPAPTPDKETMPKEITSYDQDSEYGQHRTAVLDALAVLRTSANDTTFELVTDELMTLLSSAFNEGWNTGFEHAQVNPYAP